MLAVGASRDGARTRAAAPPAQVAAAYGRLPLAFQPNRGETDARVAFFARGKGATLFLNAREAVLALRTRAKREAVLRMQLVGARPQARLHASQRLPGTVNEFLGNDPSRWRFLMKFSAGR